MGNEEKVFKRIISQFFLAVELTFYAIALIFLFASCGARKVNKSETKEKIYTKEKIVVENDITATNNITIKSKSFVIDSTKEEIEEIEVTPIDLKKPAYYENTLLNNTKLVKRKIKRNKAIKSENNTNTQHDSKALDKSTKKGEKTKQSKKNEETKNVDKKQFDPLAFFIQYWWLWLIIFLFVLLSNRSKIILLFKKIIVFIGIKKK